jgi:hypothetical protein
VIAAIATLQIHCKWNLQYEGRSGVKRGWGSCSARLSGLTAGVLAVATYFHHVRFFGFFTILAAILAILFGRTIARRMRAFVFCVLSHKTSLLSGWFVLEPLS